VRCSATIIPALLLFLFWLGVLGWPYRGAAADISESQRRLREIEARISESYRQLKGKETKEKTLQGDLAAVAKEISALEERIGKEQEKASSLLESITEKEQEINEARFMLKETEGLLKERLRVLYKEDETTLLQVFFSATSPDAALENIDFLERVVQRDKEMLSAYRSQWQKLEAALAQQVELQGRQRQVLEDLKQNRSSLEDARRLNKRLLTQVAREKKNISREIAVLRNRAKELGALIQKLEKEQEMIAAAAVEGGQFATQKGKLIWPAKGPVKIGFGTRKHPELETLYESQGIEIETGTEKPITAVWGGKVAFSNPFRGYGNLLIVNHGDGYHTLYAQASRLTKQTGDNVKKGEVVGYSGYDGSRRVYFEIRHRGVPQNPLQWLGRE